MDPLAAVAVAAALVAATTAVGLVQRAASGRVRRTVGAVVVADAAVPLAADLTLVQFSSAVCAPCRGTARVLGQLAAARDGLGHVEVDVAERPDLAREHGILQTPTTLVVDRDGRIRARIAGSMRRDLLVAEIDRVLAAAEPAAASR